MAGEVAADAAAANDTSREFLSQYQKQWKSAYGTNLRIAYEINKKIAQWSDSKWDRKIDVLKLFTAEQFGEALQANFLAGWAFSLLWSHPKVMKEGVKEIFDRFRLGKLTST